MMRRLILLCMLAVIATPSSSQAQASTGDEWLQRPVDDQTFAGFLPFFAYDRSVPLEATIGLRDTLEGLSREHLTYQSTPGVQVTNRIYLAPGGDATTPWVIFLHGGGGQGKDGNPVLLAFLARAGWNVLAMDMLHFGERRTNLLTEFLNTEKAERLYNQPARYLQWVVQNVKDLGRAIDYLVAERGADPARISLAGFSRGAQVALIAGAAEKRFRAVAVLIGGHFDLLETGHLPAACPANYIGRISPRPLLLLNATQDPDYIRSVSVEPLHRLARNPREIVWLEMDHRPPDEAGLAIVVKWLAQHGR